MGNETRRLGGSGRGRGETGRTDSLPAGLCGTVRMGRAVLCRSPPLSCSPSAGPVRLPHRCLRGVGAMPRLSVSPGAGQLSLRCRQWYQGRWRSSAKAQPGARSISRSASRPGSDGNADAHGRSALNSTGTSSTCAAAFRVSDLGSSGPSSIVLATGATSSVPPAHGSFRPQPSPAAGNHDNVGRT
jgi:hypothetical protein